MYVFCAFRDLLALACLAVVHVAVESRRLAGGAPWTPLPPHAHSAKAASPPTHGVTQKALLTHCAALGFFGVFANQLLFLKVRHRPEPVLVLQPTAAPHAHPPCPSPAPAPRTLRAAPHPWPRGWS
jgi:hypothetical protein